MKRKLKRETFFPVHFAGESKGEPPSADLRLVHRSAERLVQLQEACVEK